PQYLYLTRDDVKKLGPFGKFTPPARGEDQSDRLLEMIRSGAIQLLSSDHAPATAEQKRAGTIWECHFGLPGVETTLPLMLHLVNQGKLTLQRVVQLYLEMPARLLGLYPRKGCIQVGADADLVLVDMTHKWTIRNEQIIS